MDRTSKTNQITKIIEQKKKEGQELLNEWKRKRLLIRVDYETFLKLFKCEADLLIKKRKPADEFKLTKENEKLIKQLYYYCTINEKFEQDLSKGLLIGGTFGVGKTLIMQALCSVIALFGKNIRYIHVKKLQSDILKTGVEQYEKKPLFIDDVGKESREVVDYGTRILPIADLFALRYANYSLTFATTNYKFETLKEFYGDSIADRLKEMFNLIVLDGKSFRK